MISQGHQPGDQRYPSRLFTHSFGAESFGLLWLMPRLDKFRQAWPALKISLTCSYESIQFSRDNIDIDIRHGLSQWPTLLVKNH